MKLLTTTVVSVLAVGFAYAYQHTNNSYQTTPPSTNSPNSQNPKPKLTNNLIPGDRNYIPEIITYQSQPPSQEEQNLTRVLEMGNLLSSGNQDDYKKYKELCTQSITKPQIGMTFTQSRMTSWCYPYSRNKTTNSQGEYVQEVYLKNKNNSNSERKYLYFQNGILTTIQE